MKTETETELRELDAWILEHVFGGALALTGETNPLPHYTTDPAAAFDVLKVLADKTTVAFRKTYNGSWRIWSDSNCPMATDGPTLEISICEFARKLFTPPR